MTGSVARTPPALRHAYIGCRTTRERRARGEGLLVCAQDADGALHPVQLLGGLVNPSYLLINGDGDRLYAVHGDGQEVSAFAVDPLLGTLRHLNTRDTQGRNPVHLALSPDGCWLVVVNHLGASLAWLPVDADGALGALQALWPLTGPIGPHRSEQTQPKPHFAAWTPDGRHLLVPDKGCDRVHVLPWAGRRIGHADGPRTGPDRGAGEPTGPDVVEPMPRPAVCLLREGSGPRHLAHLCEPAAPQAGAAIGPWTAVLNELDSTLVLFEHRPDADGGLTLQPRQCLSTLPDDFMGLSRAAAIAVAPDGHRLYTSNRGHDSISVFDVDRVEGRLQRIQVQPTGGRTPRAFTLSPCGRWLYALNEDSHSVTRLAVDPQDGRLGAAHPCLETGSPTCLVFAP